MTNMQMMIAVGACLWLAFGLASGAGWKTIENDDRA
jgi:hypothetical protein